MVGINKMRRGFTLIELLVVVAIMGLLTALLVPNIDRSLQKNQLAEDVDLFTSKLEETRLLAGSTQQVDDPTNTNSGATTDLVGYYAILIRPSIAYDSFYVVRLSKDLNATGNANTCSVDTATKQTEGNLPSQNCVVDQVKLAKNDMISFKDDSSDSDHNPLHNPRVIAYTVPTQQLVLLRLEKRAGDIDYTWYVESPVFSTINPIALIKYKSEKTAAVSLGNYSGKVSVTYP